MKTGKHSIYLFFVLMFAFGAFVASLYAQEAEVQTREFELKHVDPGVLKMQLQQYLSSEGKVEVDQKRNMLIITDRPDHLNRVRDIIVQIDVPENASRDYLDIPPAGEVSYEVETVHLKHITSHTAVSLLREIIQENSADSNGAGIRMKGPVQMKEVTISSIMLVATAEDIEVIKDLLKSLDQAQRTKGNSRDQVSRVIFLQNTQAVEVSRIIDRMRQEEMRNSSRGAQGKQKSFFGQETIVYPVETSNSLVVVAPENEMDEVESFIRNIDQLPSQVLIEVIIFEVTLKEGQTFGADLSLKQQGNAQGKYDTGSNFGLKGLLNGGASGYFFNYESKYLNAILSALEETGDVKILSAPQILVAHNRQAQISIGDSVVISKETLEIPTGDVTNPLVRTTRDYVDVGLRLLITPKINHETVYLDILQEVNDIKESGVPGFPEIAKRTMETSIVVKDRQSAVLGGLISKRKSKTISKVAVVGDLPVLGRVFRKETTDVKSTELILFVTAYVIDNQDELLRLTEEQKRRIQEIRLKMLKQP